MIKVGTVVRVSKETFDSSIRCGAFCEYCDENYDTISRDGGRMVVVVVQDNAIEIVPYCSFSDEDERIRISGRDNVMKFLNAVGPIKTKKTMWRDLLEYKTKSGKER